MSADKFYSSHRVFMLERELLDEVKRTLAAHATSLPVNVRRRAYDLFLENSKPHQPSQKGEQKCNKWVKETDHGHA